MSVFSAASADDANQIFDTAKRNANDPQAVAGLGEDAFWDATLGTLNVVQGKYNHDQRLDGQRGPADRREGHRHQGAEQTALRRRR